MSEESKQVWIDRYHALDRLTMNRIEELYQENKALRAVIQRYLESADFRSMHCCCSPGHRGELDGQWIETYQCIPCQMREALAMNN